ncbi:HAD family hydrolase [Streptomyces sp. NPDC006314]|uniref:HAD family hydrolase n=1 Tax=Streptomyces sp. NPDC006314 TaxID=3154475 RepID=UPI0033B3EC2D
MATSQLYSTQEGTAARAACRELPSVWGDAGDRLRRTVRGRGLRGSRFRRCRAGPGAHRGGGRRPLHRAFARRHPRAHRRSARRRNGRCLGGAVRTAPPGGGGRAGLSPPRSARGTRRDHLPTCVVSCAHTTGCATPLGRTGLYERFGGRIHSATVVPRGEPAPDLFRYAARRMGVDPAARVVVGDGRPGAQAARAAGLRAFGHAGGLTPAEQFHAPSPSSSTACASCPSPLGERRPTPTRPARRPPARPSPGA